MKKCALVVGHKPGSPGATNKKTGISEFVFNHILAQDICELVTTVRMHIIYRDTYSGLPGKINDAEPDFIVSLHCNSFDTKVSGTETLYYHKSERGEQMAVIMQSHLVSALNLRDRGIVPRDSDGKGGPLLRYTNAPCIIAEPFFIDNDQDLDIAKESRYFLAKGYAKAIEEIAAVLP